MADDLYEDIGFMILDEAPYHYRVTFTSANPASDYAYPPATMSGRFFELTNAGALLMYYVGHGSETSFTFVDWAGETAPMVDLDDLDLLDIDGRAPLFVSIACLTGAFDEGHVVAEQFLFHPSGPTAVIAATESSTPYANAVLIREMNAAVLRERMSTAGGALLEAKQRLISAREDALRVELDTTLSILMPYLSDPEVRDDMLREQSHIYVLLGDPAQPIAHPRGTVDIALETDVIGAGGQVTGCVQVHGPPTGYASVDVVTERDSVHGPLAPWDMSDTDRDETVMANNVIANDNVLAHWEGEYENGGFAVSLAADTGYSGRAFVRVYVTDGEEAAFGSIELTLEP
jgi:hypothetical protein